MSKNTDGNTNSAFGHLALQTNTTGNANVAIGGQALIASNGGFNTAVGVQTGTELTTGSNNTLLGSGAQASAPDASNEVVIGNDDITKTTLKGTVEAPFFKGDGSQLTGISGGGDTYTKAEIDEQQLAQDAEINS